MINLDALHIGYCTCIAPGLLVLYTQYSVKFTAYLDIQKVKYSIFNPEEGKPVCCWETVVKSLFL